ncbi:MAG: hypothetical protein NVS4B3_01210 [Gemmatimonadaceae bacterium]
MTGHRGALKVVMLATTSLSIAACGGGSRQQSTVGGDVNTPAATSPSTAQPAAAQPPAAAPAEHHSKLAGAVVGGVVGHAMGGHAVAGAAAGALIQHHRNKKASY